MTQAEVEAAYQEIINRPLPSLGDYVNAPLVYVISGIGFLIIMCGVLIPLGIRRCRKPSNDSQSQAKVESRADGVQIFCGYLSFMFLLVMIFSTFLSVLSYASDTSNYGNQIQADIEQWKVDVVQPYLASLPKKEKTVRELEFYYEPEFQSKQSSSLLASSQDVTFIPNQRMLFSYTAEGQTYQHVLPQRVQKDLPKGAKPRVQFVQLTKPLGVMSEEQADRLRTYLPNLYPIHPEYAVGDYEFVVHVPADYAINGTLRW